MMRAILFNSVRALVLLLVIVKPVLAIEVGDHYQGYVADKRAFQIGDSLTLLIIENSSAKTGKGSTEGRDLSLEGGYSSTNNQENGSVSMGYNNDADNSRQHSGSLKAAITTTVTEYNDNGLLKVEGSQKIVVDGEKQLITVSGWLRPADITRDNTVLSTRLSNAEIEYTGFEKKNFFKRLFNMD